ncbi:hypothetical protein EGO66_12195, partial [Neisseria gonorrhoeae]
FKALHVPHCHPFKHGFYLTGAQPAPPICRTSGPDSRPRGNDGMYSELNLNQYGVASPFRTIRTACGPPPCPDFR